MVSTQLFPLSLTESLWGRWWEPHLKNKGSGPQLEFIKLLAMEQGWKMGQVGLQGGWPDAQARVPWQRRKKGSGE